MREVKRPSNKAPSNLLDKIIGYVNPQAALRRQSARQVMALTGGYIGASKKRSGLINYLVGGNDADSDINPDLPTLRNRTRDLCRNNPLAAGAVSTVVTEVVGPGLRLQSQIDREQLGLTEEDAAAWESKTEREFRLWAESPECDAERSQTFSQLQGLVFRSALESGDVFVLLPMIDRPGSPYKTKLQVVEADRVVNKDFAADRSKLSAGVEKDENGAPVAYHIMQSHPGITRWEKKNKKWVKVDAFGMTSGRRNVIHLFEKNRAGQTRGVPYLAPVIEPLKQLDRYTEAELTAAVVSALFTIFVKSDLDSGDSALGLPTQKSESGSSTDFDELKLKSGAIVDLNPGEDVTIANPLRPNQAFDPFVMSILRQIGMALELPFEVLIKHYQSSYSAARAAMLTAWKFYTKRRTWLSTSFCNPVYEAWLDEAVAAGRINAPGYFDDPLTRSAYLRASWIGPAKGMIDEQKEVNAAEKRIKLGLSTLAEETAAITGGDSDAKFQRSVQEATRRTDAGLYHPAVVNVPAVDYDAMTVNEKRKALKLEPIPEGDAIFKSSSEIPALEMLAKSVKK